MDARDALRAWAASGAMDLTGLAGGPPLAAPGSPALAVGADLGRVRAATVERTGRAVDLPGASVLGERAAVLGLRRQGAVSCGGSFRSVRAADGWFGLSLARPDDLDLVPALVGAPVDGDPWSALQQWAGVRTAREAETDALLLGLPAAAWPAAAVEERPAVVETLGSPRASRSDAPLVVDLTSLWAGPLCAHLLGLAGCRVVKVESTGRPDGSRRGPAAFLDLLHGGHDAVAVDFGDPADVDRLMTLLGRADLVLEASRPRALRRMGIRAEDLVASGTSWLSITARGRPDDAVGFGDDVAVAAGMAIEADGQLLPVGDALADPMTGVRAAAVASRMLLDEHAALADVSMLHVVREAMSAEVPDHIVRPDAGRWMVHVEGETFPVEPPVSRRPVAQARPLGADNERWLR